MYEALTAGTQPIILRLSPVAAVPPLPQGTVDSNVYTLSVTSAGGPVSVAPAAQSPAAAA